MNPHIVELPATLWTGAFAIFAVISMLGGFGSLLPTRLRLLVCFYEYALIVSPIFST